MDEISAKRARRRPGARLMVIGLAGCAPDLTVIAATHRPSACGGADTLP